MRKKLIHTELKTDRHLPWQFIPLRHGWIIALASLLLLSCSPPAEKVKQIVIGRIEGMPNQPEPYKMLDWAEKAHHFDQYAFNADLTGESQPFIWIDSAQRNVAQNTFGLYTIDYTASKTIAFKSRDI